MFRDNRSNKMFIGCLVSTVNEVQLRECLKDIEGLGEIKIGLNENGSCKGYAFVTINGPDENLEKALNKKICLGGRILDTSAAHSKTYRPETILRQMNHKIHVRNQPHSVNDERLTAIFSNFGEIKKAFVIVDPRTKISKLFGYVEYESRESVDKVLNEPSFYIDGNQIFITRYIPRCMKTSPNSFKNRFEFDNQNLDFQDQLSQYHNNLQGVFDLELQNSNVDNYSDADHFYMNNSNQYYTNNNYALQTYFNGCNPENHFYEQSYENSANSYPDYQNFYQQNQYYGEQNATTNLENAKNESNLYGHYTTDMPTEAYNESGLHQNLQGYETQQYNTSENIWYPQNSELGVHNPQSYDSHYDNYPTQHNVDYQNGYTASTQQGQPQDDTNGYNWYDQFDMTYNSHQSGKKNEYDSNSTRGEKISPSKI